MVAEVALDVAATGVLYGLIALAFACQYTVGKFYAFSFGIAYTAAAFGLVAVGGIVPISLGFLIGVLVGAAVNASLELGIYVPLKRRGRSPVSLMLASIGVYVVLENTIVLMFGPDVRSVRPWRSGLTLQIAGLAVPAGQALILVVAPLCAGLVLWIRRSTALGLAMRAVASNERTARVRGIGPEQVSIVWSGIAGSLAGVAGMLAALDTDAIPSMGFDALLVAVIGTVLGGRGSIFGALAGGFLLGALPAILIWVIPAAWIQATILAMFGLALLLRPQGVLGLKGRISSS